ncbi:hemolysin family protein [Limisalsivibrio acetivorans]|uniref:hemolysin family protein n=1 Tax=Limisalsivibrio acetivorans TaxID=1304888 RepID=UPI000427C943|nr:hemolysin family protein [Limisalsivibrio acetivorans]
MELASIITCILLSGFFSGSETALTSLNELKIRHLMEENKRAKVLDLWLHHPNKVLNTILIGNNIVNILGSVLAAELVRKVFGDTQIALVTGVMTLAVLIFGEITPKTFAKHNAEKIAIYIMHVLKIFYTVFFPAAYLMNKFVVGLIKITGGKLDKGPQLTEEEIEFIINVGEKEGVLENGQKEMLQNIFEIGDMNLNEIMVPRTDVVAVSIDESFDSIMEKILEHEFSRLPVYQESIDNIVGVLNVKDLLKYMSKGLEGYELKNMLRQVFFIPGTKKIDEMLTEFQKSRSHMAVVVDEYGGVSGIVTLEDILEEIVGEIWDEYDEEESEVDVIDESTFNVDSMMDIDDFCERFNIEKTEEMEKYETLGGLIFDLAGRIPETGDVYEHAGYSFHILNIEDRKLGKVEVKRLGIGSPFPDEED